MDERAQIIKDKYREAKEIGQNSDIPVKEAMAQVWQSVSKDYAAANYAQCRAKRKAEVAQRLQEVRRARKLKQKDVADMTGLNMVTLSGYEIGKSEPNMEALVRLADAYGVTLDYLVCRTDQSEQI